LLNDASCKTAAAQNLVGSCREIRSMKMSNFEMAHPRLLSVVPVDLEEILKEISNQETQEENSERS
jgi:hypothetical protein